MRHSVRRPMMLLAILVVASALAACSTPAASTSAPASAAAGGGLTGQTWEWTGGTTTDPVSQHVVPDPENYTLTFNDDGTFNAKADCNQVSGSYEAGDDGSLAVTLGPATLAACPEGSQGIEFVDQLNSADAWAIDGQTLRITLVGDDTMEFN